MLRSFSTTMLLSLLSSCLCQDTKHTQKNKYIKKPPISPSSTDKLGKEEGKKQEVSICIYHLFINLKEMQQSRPLYLCKIHCLRDS